MLRPAQAESPTIKSIEPTGPPRGARFRDRGRQSWMDDIQTAGRGGAGYDWEQRFARDGDTARRSARGSLRSMPESLYEEDARHRKGQQVRAEVPGSRKLHKTQRGC